MMTRPRIWIPALLLSTLVMSCASGGSSDDKPKVEVIKPDMQDVSAPLSDLAKLPVAEVLSLRAHEAEPARAIPHMRGHQAVTNEADPVVQDAIGGANIPSTTVAFEGMGAGLAGFTVQSAPPDTDGDIGPNHYVQIVNSSVTVFNRTGGKLLGPITTNTLFSGFAGACATTNDGDGVVRYDRIANRWVVAQFSVNGGNGPFFQCIAVSTTPDPTGTYNRYQFSYPAFNDYPKMALWPDGYYTTFNMFPNNVFGGAKSCAYDRAKMLTGAVATQECFDTSTAIGGLLASDLDGATLPPAGSPNFQLALDTNQLAFFKMHVDFTTPANATFVGPTFIPTAAFTALCDGGTCVKQPGTTGQLDSLADRLMNRLVYRRFADHEALLVSHAVTAGAGGGVRFYELRTPNTPTIFQQGTYAPDAAFRWMSSMTFDSVGNIGMGFAISSSTISPSIRYTGRLVGDPAGTMGQGEATIIAGAGAQTGGLTRFGDYSSINIDPTDDCTFWYTQEYIAASGSFNWHTRVGAFKFANCGTVTANDFNITPSPTSQTVAAGASTTYTINTAVLSGSAQPVALTVAGLPTGVTATFNPTSVNAGSSSTLTVTVPATTGASTSQLTITGTGTTATHTATVSLTVTNANAAPTVSITAPTNGSTVNGVVNVTATAADSDGTVASVKFDLPDGTSVTDTTAPFATTWNSATVTDGGGFVIRATATDNQGATATTSVTVSVANGGGGCINNTFTATDVPIAIPDNNATGITSLIPVTGNGTVASLALSLNITHTFRGDLVVTLISPGGTQFVVSNRAGGSADNLVITNQAVTTFTGQTAAGTWKLLVQDRAGADIGTLNSWSIKIVGSCTTTTHWSGAATPNLPTVDNGSACTSLTVATTGDATVAKLDIAGSHAFRSILRGTLAHNGVTVTAFPVATFPTGSGAFSFTNRAQPGLSGDASGTWTLCIIDTDAFGDTGVLNTWSVHD
jgi:subtilisin-like proprotein convertase family protein